MTAKVKEWPKAKTAYEADFHKWLTEQADLIRSGRLADVDGANVAEELEGMARSEFRSLVSALRVLLMHILKWEAQADRRSTSWAATIREQRAVYADVLEDNPSLKPRRGEALARAYKLARLAALAETGLPENSFSEDCSYTLDDVLDRRFDIERVTPRR